MIVVMARDTASEDLENVRKRIESRGLKAQINIGKSGQWSEFGVYPPRL
ncbi:MAG: hypothetical protein CM1200mP22_33410 [Dehalococcoidia bacterium]|nr:MAG: hypothetical protein CM1200mP22_33410 [Dehalococcoidia bacterium]